jgi:hypothetical protein
MSNTVTLNSNAVRSQTCPVTATADDDGTPISVAFTFDSSDTSVATVTTDTVTSGTVTAVRDPSGPSTRTCNIMASGTFNGNPVSGSGVATVVTTADSVTVTVDFGTPTP